MGRCYKKYEFCRDMSCQYHFPENRFEEENCAAPLLDMCPYTAKEFHKWVKKQGFKIIKGDR